jgi:hypothetical protein
LLLLVTFLAAMFGMQAFAAAPMVHPAGCHGPMPSAPSPAPASYQCCANGHDLAIPSVQFSCDRPVARIVRTDVCDEGSLAFTGRPHSSESIFQSASPPPSSPLRI